MNGIKIKMQTTVKKTELLDTLRKNLEKHAAIVAEARTGYVAKAKRALEARLDQLASGKIVELHFNLHAPRDHSDVYRVAINMLEWNTAAEITLGPDEFQQLVLNEWDWTNAWLSANAEYSKLARDEASTRGAND